MSSKLLRQVASRLERVARSNEAVQHQGNVPAARFDCVELPTISVRRFMKLMSNGEVTGAEWLHAVVMVDRLLECNDMDLTLYNVHRLLATAVVIAVKMQRNTFGVIDFFKQTTGLTDLVEMELVFLYMVDWDVNVSRDLYESVLDSFSDPAEEEGKSLPASPCGSSSCSSSGGVHRLVSMVSQSRCCSTPGPSPPTTPSTGMSRRSSIRSHTKIDQQ